MSFPRFPFLPDAGSGGQVGIVPAPSAGDVLSSLRGGATPWGASGAIVASSGAIANTATIIKRSAKIIPANGLNVGDSFRISIQGTCTSSNADTQLFTLRWGTAGTTADGTMLSCSIASDGSGSAIPFRAVIEVTVRTLGATATCYGGIAITNDVVGDGVCTGFSRAAAGTASTFDSTVASYLSFAYISGASTTAVTFQNVIIEQI